MLLHAPQKIANVRILVVDDDRPMREGLERVLRRDGYEVVVAADGESAWSALGACPPDAVVLDLLLPDSDGVEICRGLRRAGDRTPVLMLTARDSIDDRVAGLDAGADDYLVKPFALRELMARVRALLRRRADDEEVSVLGFEDLSLDLLAHEVKRGERRLELTRTEFSLLEVFMRHPRQVLTRSTIFEHVWGYDFGAASNTLGVYMGYLRRKTEDGGAARLLHTVRGVGYILRTP
jgi:two-component system response regulator MprA